VSGLHETFDDIAAEITPVDPPIDRTMLRGRTVRNRRRATAISGTAGVMALVAAAAVGIPALASRPARQGGAASPATGTASTAKPFSDVLLVRPVLLHAPLHSATSYGDATKVSAATMRLFDKLKCTPGPSAYTVNDSWKATVGYSAAPARYDEANSQVVACDASGGKYVLDKAVFRDSDITSIAAVQERNTGQWVVDVTLDGSAAAAFGTLTTNQYSTYWSGSQHGNEDDAVLDSTAFVINGDVQSAPETSQPITAGHMEIAGPAPAGFTKAQAEALVGQVKAQAGTHRPTAGTRQLFM
jgi:hypothetical protein